VWRPPAAEGEARSGLRSSRAPDPTAGAAAGAVLRKEAVQCSAVQCSAVQCSAVQCSAVKCISVQCSALLHSAALGKDVSVAWRGRPSGYTPYIHFLSAALGSWPWGSRH
jgi:hypothetical protein